MIIRHRHLEKGRDLDVSHEIGFVCQFPNTLLHPARLMLTRSRFALPIQSPHAQELAQQFRIDDAAFLFG